MLNALVDTATNDLLALATLSEYQVSLNPSLAPYYEALGARAENLLSRVQSASISQTEYELEMAKLSAEVENPKSPPNYILIGGILGFGAVLAWHLMGRKS